MKHSWRTVPASDHYRKHKFVNLTDTPMLAEGFSMYGVFREMLSRPKLSRPPAPLPSVKKDLKAIQSDTPVITWFGHSSYLIQDKGFNILVDPVFSGHASPVPGMIRSFPGSDIYKPEDFPEIDLLVITHNHYDHLDKATLRRLKDKIHRVVTGLGVGRELTDCGIDASLVTELDWWEQHEVTSAISLTATPARHFSGRGLVRGGSLWCSFVLQLPSHRLFIGGDSGYDSFFVEIGDRFGPFDLAILECGQYNEAWANIHMMPEQTALAATDLRAKRLLPVHWGKFTLANHIWTDPVVRVVHAAKALQLPVTTPLIGESLVLDKVYPQSRWWEQVATL